MGTSLKQIEANRRNSLKSTGPRTLAGKAASARNALALGLFSRDVVLDTGAGREDPAEFEALLSGLRGDLQPVGAMEELLVQKIAANYWRQRRLLRHETGAIAGGINEALDRLVSWYYENQRRVPGGERRLVLRHVQYGDPITEADLALQAARVARLADPGWFEFEETRAYVLASRRDDATEGLIEPSEGWDFFATPPAELEALRQAVLQREQEILAELREVARWRPEVEQLTRVHALPSSQQTDRIGKYETALERSIFRNLEVLIHLQRTRRERAGQEETEPGAAETARYDGRENGFDLEN